MPSSCTVGNITYCAYRAYLTVAPPGAPTGVTATQVGDELQVSWTPNLANPATITSSTITATPAGDIYYVSLASSYLARVDISTGASTVIDPPTPQQGARRVWSDSKGRLWISEWNSGQVSVYDPAQKAWKQWKLPGNSPHTYAVYVDETDRIWLTDFSANAIVRFNPATEKFESFPSSESGAAVRQLHGRPGEAWGAESGNNRLVMIPTK